PRAAGELAGAAPDGCAPPARPPHHPPHTTLGGGADGRPAPPPRAGAAVRELVATLDLTLDLPEIDLPVLVVHGTHDTSAPLAPTGRRAAELLPDSTLKVYENAGHGLYATHADLLTADLREFAARA
ncbi:alpha/beta fold hydrolase, partial [Streptomyces sp. NPDC059466]|uniref:alpha/beta fold hydrolase n=1 Tax=Streptomyces sp. NPDC059466 TaxID=3346843 RepID=UPI0036CAA012